MSDAASKPDYEPAKIFNDLQKDLGARINTFINHLLVLDAGILSITIGAFLGIRAGLRDARAGVRHMAGSC